MARAPYHHGDLGETLIALALDALEAQGPDAGPEALSVAALARKAGVSPMAPYRHFPDKEALLEVLARRGFAQLGARIRQIEASDPFAAIEAFGVAYVEFAIAHPGLFRLMFGRSPPTPDAVAIGDPTTVFGQFTARVAEIAAPDERADVALALWCLAHGLASLCLAGRIRGEPAPPAERLRRVLAPFRAAFEARR